MRISAAVVELGALVLGKFEEEACGELHVFLDVEVPCGKYARLEVIDDAAGSLLASLIAPIRVVLIVVGKPIGLVRTCTGRSSFRWAAPCGKVDRMLVVDNLLG